jgi:hypothetical protein
MMVCLQQTFAQTKVYLLPTLHRMHATNIQYNYDTLQAIVARIQPDVVAVELRPEDEGADTAYLRQNYPYEMWMMRYWQPAGIIKGFDWLGTELEGRPIPTRYWQDHSRIKALQQLLASDTAYSKKLEACTLYTNQRMPVLQSGSLHNILQGNDALLVRAYYDCLNSRLRGTDYEELPHFYQQRDRRLQQNVLSIINSNTGKTIVVLTGVDHYTYMLDALKKAPGIMLLQPK